MDYAKLMIFAMLLFFCSFIRGDATGRCSVSDLEVTQISGWERVGGYQHFYVKLVNRCANCTQSDVKLWCPGFDPSIDVLPEGMVRPDADGENCTLNGGGPVSGGGGVVKFSYVWTNTFSFAPLSSRIACS